MNDYYYQTGTEVCFPRSSYFAHKQWSFTTGFSAVFNCTHSDQLHKIRSRLALMFLRNFVHILRKEIIYAATVISKLIFAGIIIFLCHFLIIFAICCAFSCFPRAFDNSRVQPTSVTCLKPRLSIWVISGEYNVKFVRWACNRWRQRGATIGTN